MKVRPVHFVPDIEDAVRFYETLGLEVRSRARTGGWIELRGSGGELGLHDSASAADGEGRKGVLFSFVAEEPLETLARRLRAAGFPPDGDAVDQEWGRSLFVRAPDGTIVQVDEQEPELYT
jgi:catechol 2,3-dioxygenase-like lactoylglutathione lyase family enzyme